MGGFIVAGVAQMFDLNKEAALEELFLLTTFISGVVGERVGRRLFPFFISRGG
jgi:hypothetical protein